MQIVIDMPEDVYNYIKANGARIPYYKLTDAIKNGILLPKEHGRLMILSEDVVKREQASFSFSCQDWISEVGLSNATVAIIEADSESEE